MWTMLTVPVLLGGAVFVYRAHTSHGHAEHDIDDEEKPHLPYLHVMNKAFPWQYGDKCSAFDPHCYEKQRHAAAEAEESSDE